MSSEGTLDLERFPADRRAEHLEKAFNALDPGQDFWIRGRGDPRHYERFLSFRYPGEIGWVVDLDRGGRWVARITRKAA
jgi:uncharacterized protein (DUF2249 family)